LQLGQEIKYALLVASLSQDADGNAGVSVLIDFEERADVEAVAIFPPGAHHALIFIDIRVGDDPEASRAALDRRLRLAAHTGVVPGLCVGSLPWPPRQGAGIVQRIEELAPDLPTDTHELLEPIEA
jgi:hypothetical protein